MSRELKFVDSDRLLICSCFDVAETESDRATVTFWMEALKSSVGEDDADECRKMLRAFKRRKPKCGG